MVDIKESNDIYAVKVKTGAYIKENDIRQFIRYLIIGLSSFAIDTGILYILTEFLGLWYIESKAAAFLTAFWYNFLLNRIWSFKSRERFGRQLIKYIVLCGINLLISNGMLYIFTHIFGIMYLVSNAIVCGSIAIWNFFMYRRFIYK